MQTNPIIDLWKASVDLWASSWRFAADATRGEPERTHAAIDPEDPAADCGQGHLAVRAAGPEAMRGDCDDWDKTDQAVDESFPASDPPSR